MDKTSMCFWWEKVKHLDIPMPKTVIIPFDKVTQHAYDHLDERNLIQKDMVEAIIKEIDNYPVFIRTDYSSAKHTWVNSCFIKDRGVLENNLHRILEFNLCCDMMGLPATAFVIREYIAMAEAFKAFSYMPVNPERRYFINNGETICHHAYWIEEAINSGYHKTPLPKDWKLQLFEVNYETMKEISLLTKYANMVAKELDGFWSVDFCKAGDGKWYFIDMALGERSWHPEDCLNSKLQPKAEKGG